MLIFTSYSHESHIDCTDDIYNVRENSPPAKKGDEGRAKRSFVLGKERL